MRADVQDSTGNDRQVTVAPAAEQLLADLAELAQFGAGAESSITRPAFSPAYRAAVIWLMERMRVAGLSFRIDAAGNVIGRVGPDGPAVVCGSHIDTVPNGGRFDGALGVLAGLAAARMIAPQAKRMTRALEIIAFADEEGAFLSLLGSRAMAGAISEKEIAEASHGGQRLADAMRQAGLDPELCISARRPKSDFAAYIELHIEQGPRLEAEGVSIGVVEAIHGIDVVEHTLTGQANHSGTTPARCKRDALRAAVNAMARCYGLQNNGAVGSLNFGSLQAAPGAANVVPGKVRVIQEIRASSAWEIVSLKDQCAAIFAEATSDAQVDLASRNISFDAPAAMSELMMSRIARHATALGLTHVRMPSGAGHDAQSFANLCETGMIFVPSVGGVSHSPAEFTEADEIANGLRLLTSCICDLAGIGATDYAKEGPRP